MLKQSLIKLLAICGIFTFLHAVHSSEQLARLNAAKEAVQRQLSEAKRLHEQAEMAARSTAAHPEVVAKRRAEVSELIQHLKDIDSKIAAMHSR